MSRYDNPDGYDNGYDSNGHGRENGYRDGNGYRPPAAAAPQVPAPPTRAEATLLLAKLTGRNLGKRVKWEQRSYWRNPASAGFTFLFPLLFFFIFMAINGNNRIPVGTSTVRFAQFFVPSIVAFGIISVCYTNLTLNIVVRREFGILKRIRGTPALPSVYLAGTVLSGVVVAALLSVVTIVFGVVFYGVQFPGHYVGLVVAVGAGAFTFSAIGVALSAFIPNGDAAPAIINLLIFPLLFLSGTFQPINPHSTSGRIAGIFPVRHLNQLLFAVFNGSHGGTGVVARDLLILLAWGAVALRIGVKRFRWEPSRS